MRRRRLRIEPRIERAYELFAIRLGEETAMPPPPVSVPGLPDLPGGAEWRITPPRAPR